ncbi:MAG: hypothetical protein ACKO04_03480 [Actinomycetes bacterium]
MSEPTDVPVPPTDLPATIGALRASGWESVPVKAEVRRNVAVRLRTGQPLFPEVLGYEDTVFPQMANALLAGHDIIVLGERGQAKTRMIRSLVDLLDEWMPVVEGSEINDDPYHPVSAGAVAMVAELGDDTPVAWVHRSQRYGEKLARPTRRSPTSSARSTRSRWPRAATSATSSPSTTASCHARTVASSPSTNCPTSRSASRSGS